MSPTTAPPAPALPLAVRLRLWRDLRRLLARIDRGRLDEVRRRFGEQPEAANSKYWRLDRQLAKNLRRAHRLGLDRSDRRLAVLDLGAGFGYFAAVCGFYGHSALALDLDDASPEPPGSLYGAVTRVLGVERVLWTIEPYRPLPETGRRYDLVTAFAALFNEPATERPWGAAEWRFFLADLAGRVLAPDGRLFLNLNRCRDGRYLDDETAGLFRAAGAEIDGRNVSFRGLASRLAAGGPEIPAGAAWEA